MLEVDEAANALRLGSAMPFQLEPGDKIWVGGHGVNVDGHIDAASEPHFTDPEPIDKTTGVFAPRLDRASPTTRGGEFGYTVKEFVPPRTVLIAEPLVSQRDESENRPPTDLLNQFVTVLGKHDTSAARRSVTIAPTAGNLPNLVVYKETISRSARWSGPGGSVSVVEGGRNLLHASVCAPKQFRYPDSLEGSPNNAPGAGAYLRHDARYNVERLWGSCHLVVAALEPGTLYAFRLRAHNAGGWGPWSRVSSYVATLPLQAPATASADLSCNEVRIPFHSR